MLQQLPTCAGCTIERHTRADALCVGVLVVRGEGESEGEGSAAEEGDTACDGWPRLS